MLRSVPQVSINRGGSRSPPNPEPQKKRLMTTPKELTRASFWTKILSKVLEGTESKEHEVRP